MLYVTVFITFHWGWGKEGRKEGSCREKLEVWTIQNVIFFLLHNLQQHKAEQYGNSFCLLFLLLELKITLNSFKLFLHWEMETMMLWKSLNSNCLEGYISNYSWHVRSSMWVPCISSSDTDFFQLNDKAASMLASFMVHTGTLCCLTEGNINPWAWLG